MPNDDLIITIGALVLGLGLYKLLTDTTRAYAVTPAPVPPGGGTPCAAACASFKNSPGTYATCCKQYAANAPKPKPVAKPTTATKVYPMNYYPQSTNNLMEKVSAKPDPNLATSVPRQFTRPQNVTNRTTNNYNLYPNKTAPIDPYYGSIGGTNQTRAPSGGGGSGQPFKEIRCQTGCNQQCGKGGCDSKRSPRLQYGVYNDSPEVDFNVTVKIPSTWTGTDSATLQFGGVAHHDGCDVDGYKAYVGIGGGENKLGTEMLDKKYHDLTTCNNIQLQPGQTYRLRALKKNIGNNIQVNTWVNGKPHCSFLDTQNPTLLTRKKIKPGCPAIDQLRVDGWPDQDLSNAISVSSGPP